MADQLDSRELYGILVKRGAARARFIDWTDAHYEYQSLVADIRKWCALFSAIGLTQQACVLIQTTSEKIAVSTFTAALLDGHVPVTLTPNTRGPRLRAIAELTKPALVVIDQSVCAGEDWLAGYSVVAVSGEDQHSIRLLGRFQHAEAINNCLEASEPNFAHREPGCRSKADDLAYILFTSGTTSAPKGVMVTHRNLFTHLATLSRLFAYDSTSAIFNGLVLAHGDGLVQGPLLAMANGCRLIRPPAFSVPTLELNLSLVAEKQATHFITVPTVYRFIDRYARRDDYFDSEDFVALISVAAKLDEQLWRRLEDRFRPPVYNMYGLTETVTSALYAGPGEGLGPVGTIGKPIDIDIRLVRSDGRPAADGEPGEIWLRGENVSPGYFADPTATAEKYDGDWLKTGDLAIRRGDGAYEIAGRIKSIIMSGGFLIAPDEVDEALTSHPAVVEAVTIGIPEPDFGEIPVSAVVLDAAADELELIAHCGRLLEPQKIPKRVLTLAWIPRGEAGKPQLKQLRSIIEARLGAEQPASADTDIAELVIGIASQVFHAPIAELSLDSSPQTIARWDSFAHIALILEAERRVRRSIPIAVATGIKSLRELVDALRQPEAPVVPEPDPPPFGVFLGTSLVENAFPPRHPANDIFPAAAANEHIVSIAFANQSEMQILAQLRRAVDAGVKKIFVEINPFLLTFRFERPVSKSRMRTAIERFGDRLRTVALKLLGLAAYDERLRVFKLYYPALIRAPSDPDGIGAALGVARQRGLAVVWMAMPRSQSAANHLGSKFEARFAGSLQAFATQFGAEIWRPARSWPNECFLDNAHLNDAGRVRFMEEIRRYGATHR